MTDSAKTVVCAGSDERLEPVCAALAASRAPDGSLPKRGPRIHAAWLIVPCLAADGLMAPVIASLQGPSATLVGAAIGFGIVGCVLAQGNLLAAWLAWGEGPFLRRLWAHWKIAIGLYLVWLVGMILAVRDHEMPAVAATVALGVPLVSLAVQLPLWFARQWLGWRLVRTTADATPTSGPPLAIRDLMLATLIVAAALALARLAPVWEDGSDRWVAWAICCTVACVISAIALLPAGALLLRSPLFSRGLAWSALYAAAWIDLPWVIVAILRWYGSVTLPPAAVFVGLSSLMVMFAATLMLTAAIARDRGYRLTSGRRLRFEPR